MPKKTPIPILLLLALAIIFTFSCRDNGENNSGVNVKETGAMRVNVIWHTDDQSSQNQLNSGRALFSAPAGVVTVQAVITGDGMTTITTNHSAATGSGRTDNIPVGSNRQLTLRGLDSSNNTIYQGASISVTIIAGIVADGGTVTMESTIAGFSVSSVSGNTGEDNTQATFTVKLVSQPSANVTIGLSSNDTSEGTISYSQILFTSANWNANQTVTITGVDDNLEDGNKNYLIVFTAAVSNDANYNNLKPSDVLVTNIDNDTAGFSVSAISGNSSESGGSATFTVKLNTQPTNDVIINISSNDMGEGIVDKSSLVFTSENWNASQTVTVTGVDDDIADGNQSFSIILGTATSTDTKYNGLDPSDVSVINVDNETAGFTISTITGNTGEDSTQATFTVKLNLQPSSDVTIGISSNNINEGTVS
ncbi:MAG: hypothetical protein HOD92_07535, partial [Deltaproteobacteria bacterium]|nr:hypothetical protein [Deltaproteobacteria bacterium]